VSNGCCRRIGQEVGRPFRAHVAAGREAQKVDELVVTGSGRARQYRARAGCIGPLRNADPASPLLIDPSA
jgi:hypothetical protein